jgi:hypothetical protein
MVSGQGDNGVKMEILQIYQALIPNILVKGAEPILDTASPEVISLVQRIKDRQLTDDEKVVVLGYLNAPTRAKRQYRYTVEVDPLAAKMLREELNPATNIVYTKEDLQVVVAQIRAELPYLIEFNY